MERYFFHTADGEARPDREGTELPDIQAARAEAARTMAHIIKDAPMEAYKTGTLSINVTNSRGLTLFTLAFLAIDAPPLG